LKTSRAGASLRVLMVTPGFHPIKGGTETVVWNLSVELNRRGEHVDVLTFNMDQKWYPKWRGKTERFNGINVFRIPALRVPSTRLNPGIHLIPGRFTNLLKQYDVIHFHEMDFSFPLFSFFVSKPKVFHLHGLGWSKMSHLRKIILRHVADFYISLTRRMERDLAELGIPRSRIVHLPNAVDIDMFRPGGVKEDDLLLYLGRIVPEKGLHILIKSLRYLEKSVRLVIVGPASSPTYYERILKLTQGRNEKGKHKITYVGVISQAEVIKWYQKASVFVCPSFYEPLGIVNLEAMSCETPVVASNVGGIPEAIQNGRNGILVPPGNVVELARSIQYLLDNPQIRKKIGKEGRRRVTENFSVEIITERLCRIYNQMIA